jgi:hypothetical protein
MAMSNAQVIVTTLLAAFITGIGNAAAPLVSAAIEAYKKKRHHFDFAIA